LLFCHNPSVVPGTTCPDLRRAGGLLQPPNDSYSGSQIPWSAGLP
jgi:hypothetical protein